MGGSDLTPYRKGGGISTNFLHFVLGGNDGRDQDAKCLYGKILFLAFVAGSLQRLCSAHL